jgi:uncharacterized protein YaeQ
MALTSTLYRFRLSVSDLDRGFYEDLDFRVAQHPSESEPYLLTRIIAYALNFEDGLEFMPGLCTADDPALRLAGENGGIALWIDIGNPSPRRMHKASKASARLRIYTYKDPEPMLREARGEKIHRAEEIEVFSLDERFLKSAAGRLEKDNRWSLMHQEGELTLTMGEEAFSGSLVRHTLSV